ncbi:MAG TPA: nuclear transport factor 2 family protein, partial [Yinghuangia sp.]|nr:nuclear transport factor 2 family protein [Yinghuangia sp.]
AFQHLLANSSVTVDGDTATGRTMCHNPMLLPGDDGQQSLMMCGLWYVDTFARVDGAWRIASRTEEKSYMYVAPSTPGMG